MASAVDICNLALAHIGDPAKVSSITPPDGSVQAERCARYYPMALRSLLEMHAWNFASKRVALAELATEETPENWAYAYAYPSDSVRLQHVYPPGEVDSRQGVDFEVSALGNGTKVIYCNEAEAEATYIANVTDTAKFSGLFVDALARLLASRLAGPTIKGTPGMKIAHDHLEVFMQVELPQAKAADASERRSSVLKDFTPSSIEARR
jgi:hypothetical protein